MSRGGRGRPQVEGAGADLTARDRILRAAMELFMEHGFADTTTLQIATRARVSKRELYALVGNKQQIVAICVAERGKRMRLPMDFPAPTDRAGLQAALRTYGASLLRELTDPGVVAVFRLGIAEAKRSPGIARSLDAMGRQPSLASLAALLKSAIAAGLLPEGDIEAMMSRFGGLLFANRMIWILLGVEKAPSAKEIERSADEVASLFLALHAPAASGRTVR